MKVADELGGQKRLDAVHATLKKSQALLDELATEQNVSVVLCKFSTRTSTKRPASLLPIAFRTATLRLRHLPEQDLRSLAGRTIPARFSAHWRWGG